MSNFNKQVAARIKTLNEEIASMRTAHSLVKTETARQAIEEKIEYAQNNLRRLRGF
jgi:septal ring factor EnvC (AmiA/AmiB activator)